MIYITAIHLSGGNRHEHIADLRWRNPENGKTGQNTRQQIIEWLDGGKDRAAWVEDGRRQAKVGIVNATPRYLRTYADGVWTDNLLALPRF